jgi:hypothetical protein
MDAIQPNWYYISGIWVHIIHTSEGIYLNGELVKKHSQLEIGRKADVTNYAQCLNADQVRERYIKERK